MIIENLFDSHTHFLATGEVLSGLNLKSLKSTQDLLNLNQALSYFRGEWLVGFGWNENHFTDLNPTRQVLDSVYPNTPIFFSRADGHASWVNTCALKKLRFGDKVKRDFSPEEQAMLEFEDNGKLSGLLKEKFHIQALLALPNYSRAQKKEFLKAAIANYNQQGFTHIRDMGTSQDQFLIELELEEAKELTLHVIHNFICEDINDFERAFAEAQACLKLESPLLKVAGLKFFYDGSLGSETALLSVPYYGNLEGNKGLVNWEISDLEILMKKTWQSGFEVSVHTIGDEAAHQIVQAARRISAGGVAGVLNLEHVEVLRPETIQGMKSLHVVCHMQPCHWLSDKIWLKEKLGSLFIHAFPWENLRAAKVPVCFGSDSPIEAPILENNLKALQESASQGIKKFTVDPLQFHVSTKWPLQKTYCRWSHGKVEEVYFQGQKII